MMIMSSFFCSTSNANKFAWRSQSACFYGVINRIVSSFSFTMKKSKFLIFQITVMLAGVCLPVCLLFYCLAYIADAFSSTGSIAASVKIRDWFFNVAFRANFSAHFFSFFAGFVSFASFGSFGFNQY